MALKRHQDAFPVLQRLEGPLRRGPGSPEQASLVDWVRGAMQKCRATLGIPEQLFPGNEDQASVSGDQAFEGTFHTTSSKLKFPSTAHLKNLGAATRDDKVCDKQRQQLFCGGSRLVSVEEKIDGANLGISLDSSYRPRMQARSKMVNWKTDLQFSGLEQWLAENSSTLCEVLERNNDILFGEWCAYLHTVKYTRLPGYFVAFDIYDKRHGRFLSRPAFHTRLQRAQGPKIPTVPTVCPPRKFGSMDEVEALLTRQSVFGDGTLEGVYLRVDEEASGEGMQESFLVDRCKLVRSEFQQAIEEEGTWRGRGKNELDMAMVQTYTLECYPCALRATQAAAASACPANSSVDGTGAAKSNYPSTPHLPFSPGVNPDDSRLADCAALLQDEVVITEKLDGGNCCIKGGKVYARTHGQPTTHESFSAVKQLAQGFASDLGDIELFGENMQAVHSIEYGNLASFFYAFGARRGASWLAWDEVAELAARLGLPTVPVVFRGRLDSPAQLQACLAAWAREPSAVGLGATPEGFVVRRPGGLPPGAFGGSVAKYVRAGHIQTDDAWKRRWIKAKLGPPVQRGPLRIASGPDPLRARIGDPRVRHKVEAHGLGEVELPRNFSFLLDDVAVSSTPKNAAQISAMATLGIVVVVTLTEEYPLPAAWFENTAVRNMFVPVKNYFPPTLQQADSILDAIAEIVTAGGRVMVHCGGGKGRAGTVAACLMLRYGTESIAEGLREERGSTPVPQSDEVLVHLRNARPGSVETKEQERFVREFASTLWQRAGLGSDAPPGPTAQSLASAARGNARGRRGRDGERRAPAYMLMAGLAGSGKSSFCASLEAVGWTRASQDELGRKGCEALVSRVVPTVRRGGAQLVVDRCNLTKRERAEWLDLMGSPAAKDVACVFFDCSAEDCKARAAARLDHPTIRKGGGGRIIDEQAKILQRPDKSEGFGAVEVISSFHQAEALLRRYGVEPLAVAGGGGESAGSGDAGSPEEAAAETAEAEGLGPGSGTPAGEEESLPASFAAWLRAAVRAELPEAEAEGLLAAAEVVLAGVGSDPDALASAAEILEGGGAPRCAGELGERWLAAGGGMR